MANYYDEWKVRRYCCGQCKWEGTGSELGMGELTSELAEYCCPSCGHILETVLHPTIQESRANWDKLNEAERKEVELIENHRERFSREKLKDGSQLPDISEPEFVLHWDYVRIEYMNSRTLIKLGEEVLFAEPAAYEGYERFGEVATILKEKYGNRLKDLIPTEESHLYLYGDRLSAPQKVEQIRKELFSKNEPA